MIKALAAREGERRARPPSTERAIDNKVRVIDMTTEVRKNRGGVRDTSTRIIFASRLLYNVHRVLNHDNNINGRKRDR
jgi:hypothetical protein